MMSDDQKKIQELLIGLVDHMGIECEVEKREQNGVTIFNLKTPDSGILIGQHGSNLSALQYLARVLASKQSGKPLRFVVDVEDYKREREEFLRELGRQAAERVRETREALVLKPMMAYERRVVHEAIAEFSDVTTESQGEEPERRILIKPKE